MEKLCLTLVISFWLSIFTKGHKTIILIFNDGFKLKIKSLFIDSFAFVLPKSAEKILNIENATNF